MVNRIAKPPKSNSFFLFGARGVGKSTWVKTQILTENSHTIDLLLADTEDRYSRNPDLLISDLKALPERPDWVFVDEVQKIPKLLDVIHSIIESDKLNFILTGSSARKLKRGQANLLAGRAFVLNMFPLTYLELKDQFDLMSALEWGTLPGLLGLDVEDRKRFLKAYTQTYLKEEIQIEQIVRNLAPFREFLEISAQSSGKNINYSKIARDVAVDTKTVQNYFQILEDTLVGFHLPAFHKSVRKSQKYQPKFYYFDTGVKRSLERALDSKLVASSYAFGNLFEHFIINEVYRLNQYYNKDYRLSHYQTTGGTEIDLVLTRANETILIEIKSTSQVDPTDVKKLKVASEGFDNPQCYFISNDSQNSLIEEVHCQHWSHFLEQTFKK